MFSWGKLAVVAAAVVVAAVAVTATIVTFGAASVASTIAISSAVTIAARATEVGLLQGKKSIQDGDEPIEVVDDIVNSLYNNSGKIVGITPVTKLAGYSSGFYAASEPFQDTLELMKIDGFSAKNLIVNAGGEIVQRFKTTEYLHMNASKFSKVASYAGAAIEVGRTVISGYADDPVERAKDRGYRLK